MMTLKRFTALTESYGADPQRWPENMRAEAQALLEYSDEARINLAAARKLDDALRSASAKEASQLWNPGDQDAALARLRSSVAARIASPARQPGPYWALFASFHWAFSPRLGWVGIGWVGGMPIWSGLLIGTAFRTKQSDDLLAMLQPSPIQILAD